MWLECINLGITGAIACLCSSLVGAAESRDGFIDGSNVSVNLRNFYWNADNLNGSYRSPKARGRVIVRSGLRGYWPNLILDLPTEWWDLVWICIIWARSNSTVVTAW